VNQKSKGLDGYNEIRLIPLGDLLGLGLEGEGKGEKNILLSEHQWLDQCLSFGRYGVKVIL